MGTVICEGNTDEVEHKYNKPEGVGVVKSTGKIEMSSLKVTATVSGNKMTRS